MQSLMTAWSALNATKRLFVVLATVTVFASVLFLAKGSASRDMALLFGALDPKAAGEIVTSLDQSGASYEVRGNAIYVESGQRDLLRMTLAGQGLPASGSQGYELLDTLSGFGTTSQMFDAAYWRAKEGELARTILASPHIKAARVHISSPNARSFRREQTTSAAVNISTIGNGLSGRQVRALQYLVAAAVQGLSPSDVAVIDGESGLLSDIEGQNRSAYGDEYADELRNRAERLLDARVGHGNAVVEVSVETVTETEQITERIFDPNARVAISTDVTESTAKSQDSGGSDVTVASNLPDGAAAGNSGTSNNENSESRALTNYEVNETQRQLTKAPGDVRRLTVAVLVNDFVAIDQEGTQTATPRTPDELAALEALVASAVGLNIERGDVITLKSMTFEPLVAMGTDGLAGSGTPLNILRLVQIAALSIVSIVLGLFVVRPILLPTNQRSLPPPPSERIIEQLASPSPLGIEKASNGSLDQSPAAVLDSPNANLKGGSDPVTRLRNMISERETETIQILQDWMEQPDEVEEV